MLKAISRASAQGGAPPGGQAVTGIANPQATSVLYKFGMSPLLWAVVVVAVGGYFAVRYMR